jgi:hypothetical protein
VLFPVLVPFCGFKYKHDVIDRLHFVVIQRTTVPRFVLIEAASLFKQYWTKETSIVKDKAVFCLELEPENTKQACG